jgi:ABC-type uncharacterized transport system substrate-binding protein
MAKSPVKCGTDSRSNKSRFVNNHPEPIVNLAIKNRLPVMYTNSEFVRVGGLISYTSDGPDRLRRAAAYVDKILKGATVKGRSVTVEYWAPESRKVVANRWVSDAIRRSGETSVGYSASSQTAACST